MNMNMSVYMDDKTWSKRIRVKYDSRVWQPDPLMFFCKILHIYQFKNNKLKISQYSEVYPAFLCN
jgi:hypothetical protein